MIKFEIVNDTVSGVLRNLSRSVDDMRPFYRDVGEYLIVSTRQRFLDKRAPDGTAWKPSKSPYGTLIGETKRLSREWSYQANRGDLLFGSPMEYAATQHFGAAKGAFGKTQSGRPIPFGTIPAREIIGLSDADTRNIIDIAFEHLEMAVAAGSSAAR